MPGGGGGATFNRGEGGWINAPASSSLPKTTLRCVLLYSSVGPQWDRAPVTEAVIHSLIHPLSPLLAFLSSLPHFPHFLPCASWDHLPNTLCDPKTLSQGLFSVEANIRYNFLAILVPGCSFWLPTPLNLLDTQIDQVLPELQTLNDFLLPQNRIQDRCRSLAPLSGLAASALQLHLRRTM